MNTSELQDVIEFLAETPALLLRLAAELDGVDLKWKLSVDEFSFTENACHLRDIEREGCGVRIGKLLTEDQPQVPDIDGGRLARERDYNSQDFESAARAFSLARAENVRAMRELSIEQLNRRGVLEGVGEITLGKLFLLMREHDEAHRQELIALSSRLAGDRE